MSSTIAARVMAERRQWAGQWCWGPHDYQPWNTYVLFRKQVDLPNGARRAVVRVSADALYTLFVNGTRVHHGPARSFPDRQAYDTLDLTALLQPGPNVVAVIAHQFGAPTFQRTYRGASGFLLDGVIELEGSSATVPLHTPTGWTCRPGSAWRKNTARLSMQLGFQEHFDADAHPADWHAADYAAAEADGWVAPSVRGPVGTNPWLLMEPRGVPLLADHVEPFVTVIAQFRGENPRGYKVAEDVYHLVDPAEVRRDDDAVPTAAALLSDDEDAVAEVAPPPEGEFVALTLELGKYRTGHLILDIADAAGDEFVDVLFCEHLDAKAGLPMVLPVDDNSRESRGLRYRCRPGRQRFESFFYYGLRYALVVFRNVEAKPLRVRQIAVRQVHAAFPDELEGAGSFTCSDERLNQIWQVGVNTQLNCAFDAFVDCPGREQAMWWGDSRVQALVTAFAFGDTSLLERGIRLVAQSQTPAGSLHAHPPADVPRHQLPDFMMTWVGTVRDHWRLTGRTDLVAECLPALHRLFEFLAAHESADGLVGSFAGFWMFLDWVTIFKGDHSGPFNLMYLQSLRWAAELCRVCKDPAAAEYDAKAARVQAAVERAFWDEKLKCWRDGFDAAANKPVDSVSQHTNTLAILLGLKPDTHAAIARDVLLKAAQTKRTKTVTASPFFYAYVLDALALNGLGAEAVGLIRDKWGDFLDDGATTFYEMWTVTFESHCHAWSASPVYHLMQIVLGVRPTSPGWTTVRIAPTPETLEFARGAVPTPHGLLRVEWEKGGEDQLAVRIEVPEGIVAEFVSPDGQRQELDVGTNEFHT